MFDTRNVTRMEIVDNSNCKDCRGSGLIGIFGQPNKIQCPACHGSGIVGRQVIFYNPAKQISLSLQDDNRTLKIFINKRDKREE